MASIKGGEMLAARLEEMALGVSKGATVQVGFLPDATYPDGTLVAMVAAVQEFGAPSRKIPPRPFFRNMIKKESPHWAGDVAKLLKATDMDGARTLGLMGAEIKSELQESIADTYAPELSAITLMLRKMKADDPDLVVSGKTVGEAAARVAAGESITGVSTKPLVESGHMLGSIDFVVKEGAPE